MNPNYQIFFNCIFLFIVGICIGSFINVITYRLPNNISILPRSYCPNCKSQIKWFDNIPILSWILLSGECRSCNKEINFSYPLVELATGIIFIFCYLSNTFINTNNTSILYLISSLIMTSIYLSMSLIDIKYFWLPKSLNYLCIFLGIFLNLLLYSSFSNLNIFDSIINNIFSSFLGYFIFRSISFASKLIYKKESLGLGDALFVANLGAWNGLIGVYFSLIISFQLAGIYILIRSLMKDIDLRGYIALGPFLAIGGTIVWCIGKENIMSLLT